MITTEPDRDNTIKIGKQHYRPILIKVEYQQDFPEDMSDLDRAHAIEAEESTMIQRLDSAVNEHITKSGALRGGHLHTHRIELMILKPIKNGK